MQGPCCKLRNKVDIGYKYDRSYEVTFLEYHEDGNYYSIFPYTVTTEKKNDAVKQARAQFKEQYNLKSTRDYIVRVEELPPKAEFHNNKLGRFRSAKRYEDQLY